MNKLTNFIRQKIYLVYKLPEDCFNISKLSRSIQSKQVQCLTHQVKRQSSIIQHQLFFYRVVFFSFQMQCTLIVDSYAKLNYQHTLHTIWYKYSNCVFFKLIFNNFSQKIFLYVMWYFRIKYCLYYTLRSGKSNGNTTDFFYVQHV